MTRMFNQLHEDDQLKLKLRHPDNSSINRYMYMQHTCTHTHIHTHIHTHTHTHIHTCTHTGLHITTFSFSFPTNIKHWLVLDGPLDNTYRDIFTSLLSGQGVYHLPNGSSLRLPGEAMYTPTLIELRRKGGGGGWGCLASISSLLYMCCLSLFYLFFAACCQLLFETDSVDALCPSLLHHTAILYYKGGGVVSYEALINTWLERAPTHHNLTSMRYTPTHHNLTSMRYTPTHHNLTSMRYTPTHHNLTSSV